MKKRLAVITFGWQMDEREAEATRGREVMIPPPARPSVQDRFLPAASCQLRTEP
jgi:hypothetical protein